MRVKDGFVLRKVAGQTVAVATGDSDLDFYGMVKLNDTGETIWRCLADGLDEAAIASKLASAYEVDEAEARADVDEFVAKMREAGFIAE